MNDAVLLGMSSSYHTFDEAKNCQKQLLSKETCIDSVAYMKQLYSLRQPYCCLATSLDDCGQCLKHRCLDKEKQILFIRGLLYRLIN